MFYTKNIHYKSIKNSLLYIDVYIHKNILYVFIWNLSLKKMIKKCFTDI